MALTNFYFSPSHVVVNSELANMFNFLFIIQYRYYTLILFFFQFILLMIFLEVIELNFCDLNKNTKRKIRIRSEDDLLDNDDIQRCDSNRIEIFSNYIFETNNPETPDKEENSVKF